MTSPRHAAAPPLETRRLRLRAFDAADLAESHALWCEPKVYEFISGKAKTREEAWQSLCRHAGQWHMSGFGFWALEDKASGLLIGEMGFLDCKRDIAPSMDDTPEVGWVLHPAQHGKGLGTEALAAVSAWGDEHLPHAKTACIIAPENVASLRLAQKFGFREVALTTYKGDPTVLLHRDRRFPASP